MYQVRHLTGSTLFLSGAFKADCSVQKFIFRKISRRPMFTESYQIRARTGMFIFNGICVHIKCCIFYAELRVVDDGYNCSGNYS